MTIVLVAQILSPVPFIAVVPSYLFRSRNTAVRIVSNVLNTTAVPIRLQAAISRIAAAMRPNSRFRRDLQLAWAGRDVANVEGTCPVW